MTEVMTITEVSKQYHVSTRMLRYYEKAGIISSTRIAGYSYRVYDAAAIKSLQQILVLRKLRIPLKQIAVILNDKEQVQTLEIVQKKLSELDGEIAALSTIQDVLRVLAERLEKSMKRKVCLDLLDDTELMDIIHILDPPKTNLKEDYSMDDLLKANKVLEEKMDIRIVYLPPATVASSRAIGKEPEDVAGERIYDFIRESKLPSLKPDFRLYGFNNPSPQEGLLEHGYEFWVTIPDDMEIQEPYVKKTFDGGLYAAHCIKMGDFHEWEPFFQLMQQDEEYETDPREPFGMGGCLEEELNIYTAFTEENASTKQLDLLIPIKKRNGQA